MEASIPVQASPIHSGLSRIHDGQYERLIRAFSPSQGLTSMNELALLRRAQGDAHGVGELAAGRLSVVCAGVCTAGKHCAHNDGYTLCTYILVHVEHIDNWYMYNTCILVCKAHKSICTHNLYWYA